MSEDLVVTSDLFPFRASLKNKDAWEVIIEIKNNGSKAKKISVEIDLPPQVTFSKVGLVKNYEKHFDYFKAGTVVRLVEPAYLSSHANTGNYSGKIKVAEHMGEYGYELKTRKKEILFRIVP